MLSCVAPSYDAKLVVKGVPKGREIAKLTIVGNVTLRNENFQCLPTLLRTSPEGISSKLNINKNDGPGAVVFLLSVMALYAAVGVTAAGG